MVRSFVRSFSPCWVRALGTQFAHPSPRAFSGPGAPASPRPAGPQRSAHRRRAHNSSGAAGRPGRGSGTGGNGHATGAPGKFGEGITHAARTLAASASLLPPRLGMPASGPRLRGGGGPPARPGRGLQEAGKQGWGLLVPGQGSQACRLPVTPGPGQRREGASARLPPPIPARDPHPLPGPHPPAWVSAQRHRAAVRLGARARRAPMPSLGPPPPETSRPSPATPPARARGGGGGSRAAPRSLSADPARRDRGRGDAGGGASPGGGATRPGTLAPPRVAIPAAGSPNSGDPATTKAGLVLRAGDAHSLMEPGTEVC